MFYKFTEINVEAISCNSDSTTEKETCLFTFALRKKLSYFSLTVRVVSSWFLRVLLPDAFMFKAPQMSLKAPQFMLQCKKSIWYFFKYGRRRRQLAHSEAKATSLSCTYCNVKNCRHSLPIAAVRCLPWLKKYRKWCTLLFFS